MRYWYLVLHIQCGEYEFYSKSVQKTSRNEDFDPDAYASDFYDGGEDTYGNKTYYFNGGEVAVQAHGLQEITKKEYDVMEKYI